MSESLPYDESKFNENVKLEDILITHHNSDIGQFVGIDLLYLDNIKVKTKNVPFSPENNKVDSDSFTTYMSENKPNSYTQTKILICDWNDKKKYLIQYRMLKFYVRLGTVVHKVHEIFSFKQSKWLEKNIKFNTQKRIQAVNVFEKDIYKFLNNAFYGKTMENVRNRMKVEYFIKDDTEKIVTQQSK